MTLLGKLKNDLQGLADPKQAVNLSRFFKTGPGEYGEGDRFLGIKVPEQRKVAAKYIDLKLSDIQKILDSKIHEYRLTALIILVNKYEKGSEKERAQVYKFYLANTRNINNWDLVDVTTPKIVGAFLVDKPRNVLYKLVKSKNLWERRISVLATFAFIRNNDFKDCIKIAELLLKDEHDLIHKAVGWMLREVGKRDVSVLEEFLGKYSGVMPRTMLRYSIERLSDRKRGFYMGR